MSLDMLTSHETHRVGVALNWRSIRDRRLTRTEGKAVAIFLAPPADKAHTLTLALAFGSAQHFLTQFQVTLLDFNLPWPTKYFNSMKRRQ